MERTTVLDVDEDVVLLLLLERVGDELELGGLGGIMNSVAR